MKFAPHRAFQGRIDQLVLLHAGNACELAADNLGLPVIVVARQVGQRDLGFRESVGEISEQRLA